MSLRKRRWLSVPALLLLLRWTPAAAIPPGHCSIRADDGTEWRFAGVPFDSLDTDHFRLYYATSGQDMVPGWPDPSFRDSVLVYLETAYDTFRNAPGLAQRAPSGRGPIGPAGLPLIQAWIAWLPDDTYGTALISSGPGQVCIREGSGSFAINNHFVGSELYKQARLTSAHEIFHVVQAASGRAGSFLTESTANWSELHVWPDDYGDIGEWVFFRTPYLPLTDLGGYREYAAAIFWYFLDRYLPPTGGRLPAAEVVWRTCDRPWETALDELLADAGTDLDRLLHEFAIWNQYTSIYDDGRHYEHGDEFLQSVNVQRSYTTYPVLDASVAASRLADWTGANYLRFWGVAQREDLRITIAGDPRVERRVTAIGTVVPDTHVQLPTQLSDAEGRVEVLVENWNLYDQVVLVITNPEAPATLPLPSLDYTYSAVEEGPAAVDLEWSADSAPLVFAPNPTRHGAFLRFDVADDATPTRIEVFDVTGRLVRRVLDRALPAGTHNAAWDGRDEAGRTVAGGNYVVALSRGGERVVRRVTVVR